MFPQSSMMLAAGRRLTPLDLAPVKAWWSAGSRVVKSGSAVAAWRDQVANLELTAYGVPTWSAVGLSGKPAIQYGEPAYLTRASLPASIPIGGAEGWIFQLIKHGATPEADTQVTSFSLGASPAMNDWVNDGGFRYFQLLPGSGSVLAFPVTPGKCDVLAFHYSEPGSPKVYTAWKNDVEGGSFTSATAPASGPLLLGCEAPGHNHSVDQISDFVITGPLTDLQREQLVAALLWAAGQQARLPSGHRYETAPPYR